MIKARFSTVFRGLVHLRNDQGRRSYTEAEREGLHVPLDRRTWDRTVRAKDYDDGGYSGGSTDRPDLQRLLDDIRARKIDLIVVYKIDRLTRSLVDFAKLVELFDATACRLSRSLSSSIPRPPWGA
jgi:DNA invertase Pin-like site-specific DNA recombinase